MIRFCLIVALMAAAPVTVLAQSGQSAKDDVKAVVNKMFAAMKTSDSSALRSVFAPHVILQTIVKDSLGQATVRTESMERFVTAIGKAEPGSLDEQISFEQVLVDDAMAIAWTPYTFYYKGNFSHCGVNCFQLVKLGGVWKINFLIDTRRKQDCN